jgi:3-isopropylmalate dehydratase small subunit
MKKFTQFQSRLLPFPIDNIDTDQIIPARFQATLQRLALRCRGKSEA